MTEILQKQLFMKISNSMTIIIFFFFSLLISLLVNIQPCQSTTLLVDGVSEWKHPVVHVGDSISKYIYNYKISFNQSFFLFLFFSFNKSKFVLPTNKTKPPSLSIYYIPFFLICSQFSSTSTTTISIFSRIKEPTMSVISLKPRFSTNPIPPPTRY